MNQDKKLVTIDFIFICAVIFITYCNITVFYSLYLYLEELQIAKSWRGFIIGCSALSTIAAVFIGQPSSDCQNCSQKRAFRRLHS